MITWLLRGRTRPEQGAGRRVVGASRLQAKPFALAPPRLHVTGRGVQLSICLPISVPMMALALIPVPGATVKRVWPIGVARRIRKTRDQGCIIGSVYESWPVGVSRIVAMGVSVVRPAPVPAMRRSLRRAAKNDRRGQNKGRDANQEPRFHLALHGPRISFRSGQRPNRGAAKSDPRPVGGRSPLRGIVTTASDDGERVFHAMRALPVGRGSSTLACPPHQGQR